MEKEKYLNVDFEIIRFDTEDVITDSVIDTGENGGDEEPP